MSGYFKPGLRLLIAIAMFVAAATVWVFIIAPTALLGQMFESFYGLPPEQVIFITISIIQFVLVPAMMIGGPLLDKVGFAKVYIGGLALMCIGALLMPVAGHSYSGMIFVRTLQALGAGPVMVSGIPIAARYFAVNLRTAIIVFQSLAVTAGVPVGMQLMPKISAYTKSPQTALAWAAAFAVPGVILSIILALKINENEREEGRDSGFYMGEIKRAMANHVTWVVLICGAFASWMAGGLNLVLPGYFTAAPPVGLGYDMSAATKLLEVDGFGMIIGMVAGVLLTEKFLKGNARPVALAGFVISAIFIFLIRFSAPAADYRFMAIYVFAAFFFLGFVLPQMYGYIAKYFPRHITGNIGGLVMGAGYFCGKTIQLSQPKTAGYHEYLFIVMAVAISGALLTLFMKPGEPAGPPEE